MLWLLNCDSKSQGAVLLGNLCILGTEVSEQWREAFPGVQCEAASELGRWGSTRRREAQPRPGRVCATDLDEVDHDCLFGGVARWPAFPEVSLSHPPGGTARRYGRAGVERGARGRDPPLGASEGSARTPPPRTRRLTCAPGPLRRRSQRGVQAPEGRLELVRPLRGGRGKGPGSHGSRHSPGHAGALLRKHLWCLQLLLVQVWLFPLLSAILEYDTFSRSHSFHRVPNTYSFQISSGLLQKLLRHLNAIHDAFLPLIFQLLAVMFKSLTTGVDFNI
ncbi:uncharacterized protein LOC132226603 [Myotis daubentonii]|uniref:uncharacterized protein LOC132226603 n=1 Tax=Myotis daubentonii TaxID=98922 RepID=UPI0028731C99|nr:uncharacterized protein LOC132226603 [Myotis daubentonii]